MCRHIIPNVEHCEHKYNQEKRLRYSHTYRIFACVYAGALEKNEGAFCAPLFFSSAPVFFFFPLSLACSAFRKQIEKRKHTYIWSHPKKKNIHTAERANLRTYQYAFVVCYVMLWLDCMCSRAIKGQHFWIYKILLCFFLAYIEVQTFCAVLKKRSVSSDKYCICVAYAESHYVYFDN